MLKIRFKPGLLSFFVVGMLATLIHIIVFTILVESSFIAPAIASVPAFLVVLLFSYTANHKWTFQAFGLHHIYLPKFALVSISGLSLNVLITYTTVDLLHLWYGFSLAFVLIVVPAMTYLINRNWTYKRRTKQRLSLS